MQYMVNNAKEFIEAYAKCQPGDIISILISEQMDFEIYVDQEEHSTSDYAGCCC